MSPLQRQILEPFATHPQSPPEDQEHHVRQVRDDLLPQLQPEEALGDRPHREQADGGSTICLSYFGSPCRHGGSSCQKKNMRFIVISPGLQSALPVRGVQLRPTAVQPLSPAQPLLSTPQPTLLS